MAGHADMDQGGDVAPPSSDIRSAEFLGRRVAEVAQELSAGTGRARPASDARRIGRRR
jgi:NAD(P)H dehydrogenase (quinone)